MVNLLTQIGSESKFEEGQYIETLDYCKKHYSNGPCKLFYEKLLYGEYDYRFFSCPRGLSAFVCLINGEKHIFTCFREKETYKRGSEKFKSKAEKKFNPVLERSQILILIKHEIERIEKLEEIENKGAVLTNVSHEVKSLNAQIKEKCDVIFSSYNLEDEKSQFESQEFAELLKYIRTIYISSLMISTSFMLYDYESRPNEYLKGAAFTCNFYKKFDKIKRIFINYLNKNVRINIEGTCYKTITAYPSFEIIPLLIVENAIKYSIKDNFIAIKFIEDYSKVDVVISSFSAYCEPEEIEKIFGKGYRGKHARGVCEGSGLGLYFAKVICDLHEIGISISSDGTKISKINGVQYAPFDVTLSFSNSL